LFLDITSVFKNDAKTPVSKTIYVNYSIFTSQKYHKIAKKYHNNVTVFDFWFGV